MGLKMSLNSLVLSILTGSYAFIYNWGYFGIFLVSLVESGFVIFFPVPSFIFVFTFGSILNPFLVALSASLGATFGMITSYVLGLGGKEFLEKKYGRQLEKVKKLFEKHGSFVWIIFLAFTPLPDNVGGIFCGMIRYDIKKYLLAVFIGKLIMTLVLAYAGHYSITWMVDLFQIEMPILT